MDTKLLVPLHQYVYNPDGDEADTWGSVFPGYKFFVMDSHGLSSMITDCDSQYKHKY